MTGESIWDHPCDEYYKKLYQKESQKLKNGGAGEPVIKSASQNQKDPANDDFYLQDEESQDSVKCTAKTLTPLVVC